MASSLTIAGVLKSGSSTVSAGGSDSDGNNVAGGNVNVVVGDGRLGNVLVPSLVAVLAALDAPEDTGLDQTGLAGIAINANPGSATVLGAGVASGWNLGGGDREGTGDLGNGGVDNNGTSPV